MAIGMLLGIPVFSSIEWLLKKAIAKNKARKVRKVQSRKVVKVIAPPEDEFVKINRRCESWASILRAGDFQGGVV